MSDDADELLLDGRPAQALLAAQAAAPGDPRVVTAGVRAAAALILPRTVARFEQQLPAGTDGAVGHAVASLVCGRPGAGRAGLIDAVPAAARDLLGWWTLAELERACGDAAAAVASAGRAVSMAEGADPRWAGHVGLTFARATADAGDVRVGLRFASAALEVFVACGVCAAGLASAYDTLGGLLRRSGHADEAVEAHRAALDRWREALGEGSPNEALCRLGLGQALYRAGAGGEALAELRAALLGTQAALGAEHVDSWITSFELGRLELEAGDPFEGLARMRRARRRVAANLGAQHPVVRAMGRVLGDAR